MGWSVRDGNSALAVAHKDGVRGLKWQNSQTERPESRAATAMCDAIRIAHPDIASDANNFCSLAMRNPIRLIWNHRKMREKTPAKILRCWPAMPKSRHVFKDRAMRNAYDSDSRCGLACDASARDAKSLAMWVERCEPLNLENPNLLK